MNALEFFGTIIGIFGGIVSAVGAGHSSITDASLSISKLGFNLDTAKERGAQRASILVGVILYITGTLITILGIASGISVSDASLIQIILIAFSLGLSVTVLHFIHIRPFESRRSQLATLHRFYFEEKNEASWRFDNQQSGWRAKILAQLDVRAELSMEEFEKLIKG